MDKIFKYPRTPHLEGSRNQIGDDDEQILYKNLLGSHIVIEEKMDGANSGISFSDDCTLLLQSRGHYLTGGGRERHFNRMKQWANHHVELLFDLLGNRYLMYGEWMASKHTVFYDRLPHLFMEFDIYDKKEDCFLSTAKRRELIGDAPIVSVPVLYEGIAPVHQKDMIKLIGPSSAKSVQWQENLREAARRAGVDPERAVKETEASDLMEGVYIKIETPGQTIGRLKWVRSGFLQTLMDSDSHWQSRPIIENMLAPGIDIFSQPRRKTQP